MGHIHVIFLSLGVLQQSHIRPIMSFLNLYHSLIGLSISKTSNTVSSFYHSPIRPQHLSQAPLPLKAPSFSIFTPLITKPALGHKFNNSQSLSSNSPPRIFSPHFAGPPHNTRALLGFLSPRPRGIHSLPVSSAPKCFSPPLSASPDEEFRFPVNQCVLPKIIIRRVFCVV